MSAGVRGRVTMSTPFMDGHARLSVSVPRSVSTGDVLILPLDDAARKARVEACAKALFAANFDNPWESLTDTMRADFREAARAVLAALGDA